MPATSRDITTPACARASKRTVVVYPVAVPVEALYGCPVRDPHNDGKGICFVEFGDETIFPFTRLYSRGLIIDSLDIGYGDSLRRIEHVEGGGGK